MSRAPRPTETLNEQVRCDLPTRDGRRCGQWGDARLPEGICLDHALAVYRAVRKVVEEAT